MKALEKTGNNPHFRSQYITLDSILSGPVKTYNSNGIVVTQVPSVEGSDIVIQTVVCHAASGENFIAETRLPADTSSAQKAGSGITYAKRYALTSILALGSEDDDGNATSGAPTQRTTRPRVTQRSVLKDPLQEL